ncbi:hypothetical protein BJL95_04440 [Methylomonas sp. LWB]|uniref:hypothetical protein n=1 Tax=Methylomonas sp. LWB TaxID=1905845 RepID=UPI0008DABC0B|nr:hypothetical protein [Methylomonas sp. LWB]OHX37827.1 hypothetical protein BJL95_04440 [Methylomonas sp. LWB]
MARTRQLFKAFCLRVLEIASAFPLIRFTGWFGILLVVLVVLGLPVGLYAYNFRHSSLSPAPADWGVLGDYLNPFISVLNLLVVAYIAHKVNFEQRRKDLEDRDTERQLNLVSDLLREWMSENMYQSRTKADCLLKVNPDRSFDHFDALFPWKLSIFGLS